MAFNVFFAWVSVGFALSFLLRTWRKYLFFSKISTLVTLGRSFVGQLTIIWDIRLSHLSLCGPFLWLRNRLSHSFFLNRTQTIIPTLLNLPLSSWSLFQSIFLCIQIWLASSSFFRRQSNLFISVSQAVLFFSMPCTHAFHLILLQNRFWLCYCVCWSSL